jgi:hypothetical protein
MPLLFACPLRPLRTWYRRLVQFATLTLAVCALLPRFSQAAPDQAKGATPWAMLLCNYADANVPANWQVSDFQRLFTPGQQGLSDYFHDVSYGAVDLSGSRVFGWFTLPYLENEAQRTITADATILAGSGILVSRNGHFHANDVGKEVWLGADGVLMPFTKIAATVPYDDSIALLDKAALKRADNVDVKIKKTRESLIEDCAHAAEAANVDLSGYYGIIAMRNDAFDSDSTGRVTLTLNGKTKTYGLVLLSDGGLGLNVSHISHEMLHGYGLQHSYGDPAIPCNNFKSGVYCDPWDIMSAMSVNAFKGAFGLSSGLNWVPWSGPGLDAGNLELLGWVPASRRWVWGGASGSVGLAPLGRAALPGMLSVLIPLQGYPAHYYSLELRSSDGWDRAFAAGSAAPCQRMRCLGECFFGR